MTDQSDIMANVNREYVLQVLGMHKNDLLRNYGLLRLGVLAQVPDLLRMANLREDLEDLLHARSILFVIVNR